MTAVLSHSWQPHPPSPDISAAQLTQIVPLLLKTDCGGLGWWRVQHSGLRTSAAAQRLKHAYISQVVKAELQQGEIVQALGLLGSAGIEPLLGKGWAISRLYPNAGLRSYTDIDLCVPGQERSIAARILREPMAGGCRVDLHTEFRPLDRDVEALYLHSHLVPLGQIMVRVLGSEDQVRLSCLHMLYHGAFRPVWLCDLGQALESLPPDFDWSYFLRGDPQFSDWVLCALGLAHRLLGASLPKNSPVAERANRLPGWLVPSILGQWGTVEHYMYSLPMANYLGHPRELFKALRLRWPNPIQATVRTGGPFNELPRLPFQVAECFRRTANFLTKELR